MLCFYRTLSLSGVQYNKYPTEENKSHYNKQRNFCVNLLRKQKKYYYNNLDISVFNDNKKFWQRIKPLFSDKQKSLQKELILIDNEEIITDEKEVAEKLNNFFIETVENLYTDYFLERDKYEGNPNDTIEDMVKKYEAP